MFSTRYNIHTNSSASWTLYVVRSPSPRCWSSLCSLTNTPHAVFMVCTAVLVHWVSSAVWNPPPQELQYSCHQVLGQSVIWKVEVKVPVYGKEQQGNHSSSVAVILFCHRLSSWYRLSTRYRTSFHWLFFASTLLHRVLDILLYRFLPVFGTVDTGKGWHSQVCPCAIGGINTCHKMRHSQSLPTVTY